MDTFLLPWCLREPALNSREREMRGVEVLGPESTRLNVVVLKVVRVFLLCTPDYVPGMKFGTDSTILRKRRLWWQSHDCLGFDLLAVSR